MELLNKQQILHKLLEKFGSDKGLLSGENLGTNEELSIALSSPTLKRASYVFEEKEGNISGYDIIMRVYEKSDMTNKIGSDIVMHTGNTGQTSGTVDLPYNHVELILVNNDGSATGTVDAAAQAISS